METSLIIIVLVVSGVVGLAVGEAKGRAWEGLVLCLTLGPIGAVFLAAMPPSEKYLAARDEQMATALARALHASSVGPSAADSGETSASRVTHGDPAPTVPEVSFTLDSCAGVGRGDEAPTISVQPGWVFIDACPDTCDNEEHELALDPITARLMASRVRDAVTTRLAQRIPAGDGVITVEWFNDPELETGALIDWTALYLPERVAPETADAECGWIFLEGDLADEDGQLIAFLNALDTAAAVADQWGDHTLTEAGARRRLEGYTPVPQGEIA